MHLHPNAVLVDGDNKPEYSSLEELEQAADGWFYDPLEKAGLVYVKTQAMSLDSPFVVEIDGILGEEEYALDDEVKVLPNPSGGEVLVSTDQLQILEVSIYNMSGALLNDSIHRGIEKHSAKLDLSKLPNGIYHIEVLTDKGKVMKKITLVK